MLYVVIYDIHRACTYRVFQITCSSLFWKEATPGSWEKQVEKFTIEISDDGAFTYRRPPEVPETEGNLKIVHKIKRGSRVVWNSLYNVRILHWKQNKAIRAEAPSSDSIIFDIRAEGFGFIPLRDPLRDRCPLARFLFRRKRAARRPIDSNAWFVYYVICISYKYVRNG